MLRRTKSKKGAPQLGVQHSKTSTQETGIKTMKRLDPFHLKYNFWPLVGYWLTF